MGIAGTDLVAAVLGVVDPVPVVGIAGTDLVAAVLGVVDPVPVGGITKFLKSCCLFCCLVSRVLGAGRGAGCNCTCLFLCPVGAPRTGRCASGLLTSLILVSCLFAVMKE